MVNSPAHLPHPKYRPDIDGLRAIAILSVVSFHAFPNFIKGGFIGVDLFFVISGYLISTIIFDRLDSNSFSFLDFYSRRIKRIFPALIIVSVSSYLFGLFILLPDELLQLGKQISAGAGFFSNIFFWRQSGYFDTSAETKPFLHLWSLGVEEQFYILWPLVIWICWKRKVNFVTTTLLIILLSFYLNLEGIQKDSVATFYSPQTRFWEILSGGFLASLSLNRNNSRPSVRFSNFISVCGLLLFVCGLWQVNSATNFPGYWALIPVLSAALIIYAGHEAWLNRSFLSNKLLVSLGLISYPLYLWHWPILSFARIINGQQLSWYISFLLVLLSILLAWLTYKLIEMPIRFYKNEKTVILSLMGTMVLIGGLGYNTQNVVGLALESNPTENTAQFYLPDLKEYENTCKAMMGDGYFGYCVSSKNLKVDESPEILFLGDSYGKALSVGLIDNHLEDVRFMAIGKPGCAPILSHPAFRSSNCAAVYKSILNFIEKKDLIKTTVVFTTHFTNYSDNEDFFDGIVSTLNILEPKVKKIVIVHQIPELGYDPRRCVERPLRLKPKECTILRQDVLNSQLKYREKLKLRLSVFKNLIFYDPLDVFCDSNQCYALRNNKMMYRNDDHIGILGARTIILDMNKKIY